MNILDGNSVAESNYQFNQSQVDKDWELSKPEKCDAVIEYAGKILREEVSKQEFNWTFNDFYLDNGEWSEGFESAIDTIVLTGKVVDTSFNRKLVLISLESASHILYDVELDELSTWSQGEDNLERMINEVLKG